MNGIDHFQRAEELAARISGGWGGGDSSEDLALAQVHATLALAAATADATRFRRALMEASGEELPADKRGDANERRAAALAAALVD